MAALKIQSVSSNCKRAEEKAALPLKVEAETQLNLSNWQQTENFAEVSTRDTVGPEGGSALQLCPMMFGDGDV